jgi:hypothetical protein
MTVSHIRILIAADRPGEVAELALRSEDFRVLTVTNRESVVTISRSEGIDLRDVPMHSSDAVIHRSFKNWPISLTAHDLLSCGQKWLVCLTPFFKEGRACKPVVTLFPARPCIARFLSAYYSSAGPIPPGLLLGSINAGTPFTDRLTPGTVGIDLLFPGVVAGLPCDAGLRVCVLIDRNDLPKHLFGIPDLDAFRGPVRGASWPAHGSGSGDAAPVPAGTIKVSRTWSTARACCSDSFMDGHG